ncbi:MAG: NAD(P)-dependent oxidoreductase [Candidatus Symbiobacter sp.]|nr:NAD(P)-dependent oxidoreductase [Candidatus Symbiobacter sp.]
MPPTSTNRKICGFVGLGAMGAGMAKNLRAQGYPLVVMGHKNRAPIERLLLMGATEATHPSQLGEQCDVILLCVTGSAEVSAILTGQDGIFAAKRRPGQSPLVIIDCSTSDPSVTIKLAALAKTHGMNLVDAPLGRTPVEAEAGTLDMMVGCDPAIWPEIEPILRCCAKNINVLGEVGAGHTMKLVNNYIALGMAALFADSLSLAVKGGITAAQFHQVIGGSRMRNGFYDTFIGGTLAGNPSTHAFAISNAAKDTHYALNFAASVGADSDLKSAVAALFARMVADGKGGQFIPTLADFVASEQGVLPSQLRG